MQNSPRLDEDTVRFLESEYDRRYPSGPHSREDQSLADRVRRSISWLRRVVRVSHDDVPSRFVELWIALNALYGHPIYLKGSYATEEKSYRRFMENLVSLDLSEKQLSANMKRIEESVKDLVENKYLWQEFWQGDQAGLDKKRQKETQTLEVAIQRNDVATFFTCAMKRLMILRNQLVHGSSSENTTRNEDALKPGLLILEGMIPVFLRLLITHGIGKDLPLVPYPGKGTFQHPE